MCILIVSRCIRCECHEIKTTNHLFLIVILLDPCEFYFASASGL